MRPSPMMGAGRGESECGEESPSPGCMDLCGVLFLSGRGGGADHCTDLFAQDRMDHGRTGKVLKGPERFGVSVPCHAGEEVDSIVLDPVHHRFVTVLDGEIEVKDGFVVIAVHNNHH
jgi:hypothetical protein